MNIQFVRLDEDVCKLINQDARRERRTVSALVNEILRAYLAKRDSLVAPQSERPAKET